MIGSKQVRAAVGLSYQGRGAIERRPVAVAGVLMPIGAAAKQFPAVGKVALA
jgi:hypothetical protein